ncbi:MAG: GrpB family protein [Candidatus Hodarchaeota archaeon]
MADKIVIVPYNDEWPKLFLRIAGELRKALGQTALRIDHIGSTAIPGLAAKPVIDLQISVASLEPLDLYRKPIESLGYALRPNNPDLTKRYFREVPGKRRTHIHVKRAGSWTEQCALLFRDYLRVHNEDLERYAKLKYQLAEKYRDDRKSYTETKGPFIWTIMAKASEWSQNIGWEPEPTDA